MGLFPWGKDLRNYWVGGMCGCTNTRAEGHGYEAEMKRSHDNKVNTKP